MLSVKLRFFCLQCDKFLSTIVTCRLFNWDNAIQAFLKTLILSYFQACQQIDPSILAQPSQLKKYYLRI